MTEKTPQEDSFLTPVDRMRAATTKARVFENIFSTVVDVASMEVLVRFVEKYPDTKEAQNMAEMFENLDTYVRPRGETIKRTPEEIEGIYKDSDMKERIGNWYALLEQYFKKHSRENEWNALLEGEKKKTTETTEETK